MKAIKYILIIGSLLLLTSSCGGSSSGGKKDGKKPVTKSFTISLSEVEVQRVSNGEPVNVDIDGIKSGSLTFE